MSYEADLLNAYRDQLANIRVAMKALENHIEYMNDTYNANMLNGHEAYILEDLQSAINSTEADDIENMFHSNELPILLPDDDSPDIRLPGDDTALGLGVSHDH